ncbi:Folylpolyglutamate synthase like protein [Verticillium longisporum]|nr:Folylpolyglutamate synthase like protein [Verticillium longisporum]
MKNFFKVWDGLGLRLDDTGPPKQLQLLFILSVHILLKERVDIAIIETHHDGEFELTNMIPRPVVIAITIIGRDHLQELVGTIENIAWHKGGIFKTGSRALSVRQDPAVTEVLKERGNDRNVDIRIFKASDHLPGHFQDATQAINASLAKEACDEFLRNQGSCLSPQDLEAGIRGFNWPGRLQVVERDNQQDSFAAFSVQKAPPVF